MIPDRTLLPKYAQIVATLRSDIEENRIPVGSVLPSEDGFARRFGVSRMTVRQAHAVLAQQGLIERRQGVGTVVVNNTIRRSIGSLTGFAEDVSSAGHRPGAVVLSFKRIVPDAGVAAALCVEVGASVVTFERLRTIDGQPVGLQEEWVPDALVPGISPQDLEDASFYSLIEDRYGLQVESADQRMHARLPTDRESAILKIPAGIPVWVVERRSRLIDDRPFEMLHALYRADRISYGTRLVRATASGPAPDERAAFLVHMSSDEGGIRTQQQGYEEERN